MQAKTGIANRALRPLLGIVDPLHTKWDFGANFVHFLQHAWHCIEPRCIADICRREWPPSLALTSSATPWVPSHTRPSSKIADILRVIHGDPIHCPGSSACSAQPETSLPGGCLLLFSDNLLYQVGKNVFCSSWLNCFRGATPSRISGHGILWA